MEHTDPLTDVNRLANTAALAPLSRDFYCRDTLAVARDLLGCQLVRYYEGELLVAKIVETEAYRGSEDSACHAHRRKTPRTEAMFGPPGHAYVYLVYGMHWLLNVVTQPEGNPCAVLIRAVEPVVGEAAMRALRDVKGRNLTNGPGKLTRALHIDKTLYGHDMTQSNALWITAGEPPDAVASGPRVGIDYAQPADRDAPWRLWSDGNPWVSKAR
ncbi:MULTISPECIES: DNA-3-methyladenine glycosylase [Vreelandella]|uniref:Putative 3-methyladenine DNA glycosylase n=2 Tax=Vreelandella TaxID=3137766 RepID=A0A7C9JSW1_9GAMM|nr:MULTISPECIES: DNA-3-methyladenine glycosylase [Halomonas]NDL70303.1 DNA-3-methyladenine glycosylase [Halomonas alkaliphila]NYS45119.1 DNA-3-methyladenine glycosylase [Halomonas zhaodongensis]